MRGPLKIIETVTPRILECQDYIPVSPDRPLMRKRKILVVLQEPEEPEEVKMDHAIPGNYINKEADEDT